MVMMIVSKSLRGWTAACALAWALVLCAGCATTSGDGMVSEASLGVPAMADGSMGTNQPVQAGINPEVFKIGDNLTIKYDDLPVMIPPFDGHVKADGTITLIYNERFEVAGKTPGQLEREIRERYVPRLYKNMTVTVRPVNESRIFYVGGEVRAPGRQMYLPGITVMKAIQSAGYFTDFANRKKVKLTRADGKKTYTIDCKKVLRDASKDIEVYPNDTIIVPRSLY